VEQRVGVDNGREPGACPREPGNRLHRLLVTNAILGERFSGPALGRRNPVEQVLYQRDVLGQVVPLNGPDGVRQFAPGRDRVILGRGGRGGFSDLSTARRSWRSTLGGGIRVEGSTLLSRCPGAKGLEREWIEG
jgi:hypothetical protein